MSTTNGRVCDDAADLELPVLQTRAPGLVGEVNDTSCTRIVVAVVYMYASRREKNDVYKLLARTTNEFVWRDGRGEAVCYYRRVP